MSHLREASVKMTHSETWDCRMAFFDYNYIYSAYANDATFFLKDIMSIKHMAETFLLYFSEFHNFTKTIE